MLRVLESNQVAPGYEPGEVAVPLPRDIRQKSSFLCDQVIIVHVFEKYKKCAIVLFMSA